MNEIEDFSATKPNRTAWINTLHARVQRYRNLLLKRWWVLLITIPVAVGVEAWRLADAPPQFSSVGQMIVNIKLNTQQGSIGSLYSEELGNFLGTQAALMQGQAVLNRARARVTASNPELARSSINVDVSILPKTTIFILRATGNEPQYTQKFLQACMEEYIGLKKEMATHTSDTTIAGMTEQIQRLEPELNRVDDQIISFLSTNDIALLEQSTGMNNFLAILYQRLADAQSEYDLLKSMTLDQSLLLEQQSQPAMLRSGATGTENAAAGANVLVNAGLDGQQAANSIGQQYLSTKQQILLLKADKERLGEYLKPKHPHVVALDETIDRFGRLLAIYRDQSVEQLEARKSALEQQIKNWQKQTIELGRQNLVLDRKRLVYERLKARGERVQMLYDQLLTSMQMLDVNKEISPESVTIYQPATEALPLSALLVRTLLLAVLVGLALGLAVLFLLDRLDDRVNSFTELQEFFDENVLGQIPNESSLATGGEVPLLYTNAAPTPFVESFRNLRSSLLYLGQAGQHPRTLLVTSSVPDDGKSFVAANLAASLAMSGSRVLLVDADLRKGGLHAGFGITAVKGLGQMLKEKLDWHTVVLPTKVPGLQLLPRGQVDKASTEFFFAADMENFLTAAGKEFDYVIVDTPPVLAADDAVSLAPRMDGVLFVIRAEATSARVARASLDLLLQRKATVLGIVLNAVRPNAADYHYYGRYKDYHTS